jgi:hypothetical protein
MTGFDSKRQAAQAKLDDDAYTLTIVYQRGFADGKRAAQPEQQAESVAYDKTEINCFVQSLYDEKMQEGKHGHYETMFHVVHQAIKKVAPPKQQAEPVGMRMPKVGDRVICLEDESLGTVMSLTAGGSPDITFDDGSRGTYLLREFAELFGYVATPQRPWVGLTDEERKDALVSVDAETKRLPPGMTAFARAIEAKLKERNGY